MSAQNVVKVCEKRLFSTTYIRRVTILWSGAGTGKVFSGSGQAFLAGTRQDFLSNVQKLGQTGLTQILQWLLFCLMVY